MNPTRAAIALTNQAVDLWCRLTELAEVELAMRPQTTVCHCERCAASLARSERLERLVERARVRMARRDRVASVWSRPLGV